MKRHLLVFLALGIGAAALTSCRQELAPGACGVAARNIIIYQPKETPIGPGNFTFYFRNGEPLRNVYVDGYGLTPAKDWRIGDGKLTIFINYKNIEDWVQRFIERGMYPSIDGFYDKYSGGFLVRFFNTYQLYGVEKYQPYGVGNTAGEMTYAAPEARADYVAWNKWSKPKVVTLKFGKQYLRDVPYVGVEPPIDYVGDTRKAKWQIKSGLKFNDIKDDLEDKGYSVDPVDKYHPDVFTVSGNGEHWQAAIRNYAVLTLSMRCFTLLEKEAVPLSPSPTDCVVFKHKDKDYRFAFPEGGYLKDDSEFWYVGGSLSDAEWIVTDYKYRTKERVDKDSTGEYYEYENETDSKKLVLKSVEDSDNVDKLCFPKNSWELWGEKFD